MLIDLNAHCLALYKWRKNQALRVGAVILLGYCLYCTVETQTLQQMSTYVDHVERAPTAASTIGDLRIYLRSAE